MRFFVVPDDAAGEAVVSSLRGRAGLRIVQHESGRPWIAGWWRDEEMAWAAVGRRRIAILGMAAAAPRWLAGYVAALNGPGGLDGLSRELPGSFHAVAVVDGVVCVQGSLSTVREVFHGRVLDTTVAADRPDTLAALTGAGVREDLLATRLIAPAPPWPLEERCLWKGVHALPPGCRLEIDPGGRSRIRHWFHPPAPTLPLADGAHRVREALRDAVAVRAHGRMTLSADLSGGMDSTSVCFLAAGKVKRLVTVLHEGADQGSDDARWAELAATAMPNTELVVHGRRAFPLNFAGLLADDPDLEAPFPAIRVRAVLQEQARRLAAAGLTRHLTGHGGDELFHPTPGYLYDLVRRRPLQGIRQVRANRAIYRWATGPTIRELLDRTSFSRWLGRNVGRTLDEPIRGVNSTPLSGWGIAYRMPGWATPDAMASVRRTLRETADAVAEPLSDLRGRHMMLQSVRCAGALMRRTSRLSARYGVTIEAPFLDDQVVEAALALDYADCMAADRYKPALVEAMRGIVPDANLGRRSKAEFSADVYAGLRRHRDELLELCDGMRLADLGLVDATALRATLLNLPPFSLRLMPLLGTFACEVWLRSMPAGTPEAPARLKGSR
ncbi:asparagine synthase (glutamine-hydrolysing) [Thermomonospora echinospora]|uniref:asparagine synthase (glutamine-hydrolyzing) n=1 Tax=Thermomonospora echinospora TaxID=1992 RepID=A0A1H6DJG7_9ACTN|nr:asparagine synthase-related protein [Thermomonospora echinospora]SEG85537.1 asparagine synthase (glutamine-hydrolysing) [Thermomonospora echinospora]